jgi:excinuclease ABC subunit A
MDKIIIRGAKEHNLKNVSLEIPRNKMTVFTGISGSGKSSLAFDTIFAEGQRRYVESLSSYARQFLSKMDKPEVDEIEGLSPAISIDQKAHSHNPRSTVATVTEIYDFLRVLFARIGKPHCPICKGEISSLTSDQIVDIILSDVPLKNKEKQKEKENIIVLAPIVKGRKGEYYQLLYDLLNEGFRRVRIDNNFYSLRERIVMPRYEKHNICVVIDEIPTSLEKKETRARLAEAVETALKKGGGFLDVIVDGKEKQFSEKLTCIKDNFSFPAIEPRLFSFNSPYGACPKCNGIGREEMFSEKPCKMCNGKRLREEALSVFVLGKNIDEVVNMSITDGVQFFQSLEKKLTPYELEIAQAVLREIKNRAGFLLDIGLGYLTFSRESRTLSGGEAQRIRLASQIGSRLVGTLYILDEPTIGLHQEDNAKLIKTLKSLRDIGNTIIVVEHDEETIFASDFLVDFGPGAGINGGNIVASGNIPEIIKDKTKKSLTLDYLRKEKKIAVPEKWRQVKTTTPSIKIRGAKEHNLKKINVDIPLSRFVAVTGVSGSGKSTLVYDVLYKNLANKINRSHLEEGKCNKISGTEYINKVINISQAPIGRTPRSTPVTYVGAFTEIRELFSYTEEAKLRGWNASRFSFNVSGGRCEACNGYGYVAVEMHFLPTVFVTCHVCEGKRFNRETLEVKYRGKSIYDVLNLTVEESLSLFHDTPWIAKKMQILKDVGLGYLTLGQSATTLSGGEAQRIKLSAELAKPDTRNTFYILDEPTVGLHYDDVKKLIYVLQRLVDRGNTVVVIEHNLDVIKNADYIIDLGPEGGEKGGEVIATGNPKEISRKGQSLTGKYLRKVL